MIDDEFEVCFEFLLSIMLAKRPRVPCQVNIPGAQKKKQKKTTRYIL
jgi:hypothetical protein